MKIYIVRHGMTEENTRQILQGHMPGTLTELGKEQMRHTAEKLADTDTDFRHIVSSDLKRTMDSAHIIGERLNLPVVRLDLLRERDWGSYTGIPVRNAVEKYFKDGKWNFPITDHPAETEEEIRARAHRALDTLRKKHEGNDNIIVVTHGLFARFMIAAHFNCHHREVTPFVNAEFRILKI